METLTILDNALTTINFQIDDASVKTKSINELYKEKKSIESRIFDLKELEFLNS